MNKNDKEYMIRDLEEGDIPILVAGLRESDRIEVEALNHLQVPIEDILKESLGRASVGLVDGVPFVVFGYSRCSVDDTSVFIWALGTEELPKHSRLFLRASLDVLHYIFDTFPDVITLKNNVYAANTLHLRWLRFCGAVITEQSIPLGIHGELFSPFKITRETLRSCA